MNLKELLIHINYQVLSGDLNVTIGKINYDSRDVDETSCFIAISGFKVDGHDFVQQAISQGAKAIVIEKDIADLPADVTVIKVQNTRKAMAIMANNYYQYPSTSFEMIGVTGTNGKTTTVFLIEQILKAYGKATGLIGTIENHIKDQVMVAERTTPESLDLQKLLSDMREASVDATVMEVSSHALDLYRVYMTQYDVGVFTNLTLDHLDYHKTMEAYLEAKAKLFQMCKFGVVNIDDSAGETIIRKATCEEIITYSTENEAADLFAKNIIMDADGVTFDLIVEGKIYSMTYQTPGKFSVYNALAAVGACLAIQVPIDVIVEAFKTIQGVPGRFQSISSSKGYSAIVDYAHAPDGLLNVLKSIKEFAKGRIITVFGCGGDRDKSKRPVMGKIAGEYSDFCVITSDNPRTEDPCTILDEIEIGMIQTECPYTKIVDRREGMHFALTMAEEKDVILIAGKGHEDYQILGTTKIHFDDVEVVKEFIQGES